MPPTSTTAGASPRPRPSTSSSAEWTSPLPEEAGFHPNDNSHPSMDPFEVFADANVRVTATLVQHRPVAPHSPSGSTPPTARWSFPATPPRAGTWWSRPGHGPAAAEAIDIDVEKVYAEAGRKNSPHRWTTTGRRTPPRRTLASSRRRPAPRPWRCIIWFRRRRQWRRGWPPRKPSTGPCGALGPGHHPHRPLRPARPPVPRRRRTVPRRTAPPTRRNTMKDPLGRPAHPDFPVPLRAVRLAAAACSAVSRRRPAGRLRLPGAGAPAGGTPAGSASAGPLPAGVSESALGAQALALGEPVTGGAHRGPLRTGRGPGSGRFGGLQLHRAAGDLRRPVRLRRKRETWFRNWPNPRRPATRARPGR